MNHSAVNNIPGLWRLEAGTAGYALVRQGRCLLIDCPAAEVREALAALGIAPPDAILHTQVQEEHCREWAAFPETPVWVAESAREVALRSPQFSRDCRTTWPPDRNWDSRGEENYGIAGCTTERPPAQPLNVQGLLRPGERFRWQDIELEVLPLPGSGKRSIGLLWRAAQVCFTGDLIHAGGQVVNLYDLERAYGLLSGHEQARASLRLLAGLDLRLLLPSTGPLISAPAADLASLETRLTKPLAVTPRRAGTTWALTNFSPLREFGRWRENLPGVFQNNNFGNVVLFVDEAGRALMVDPDFCVWKSWEENVRGWNADLDLLGREAGLRSVERALVTHYHGDHIQYCDELRRRFGTRIQTTADVAAVMETPERFPYPCRVDWYGFPFASVRVDDRLAPDAAYRWRDLEYTPVHTPGHCFAHTGYLIQWRGRRLFCSGDAVQYGAGPIGAGLPILYNDTAWPERGLSMTLRRLVELKPAFVLGGHSHAFADPDGSIVKDMLAAQLEAEAQLQRLVPDADLGRAMTPPDYDRARDTLR